MPSADFCCTVKRIAPLSSRDSTTCNRSPVVSSTAFGAPPPDLPPPALMDMGFAAHCQLARECMASYPVLVHRHTPLLHASFRPRLATTPLRFANPSPPSGWIRDLHPQTVEHARHTMTVCGKHGKTTKTFSHPSHKPWKSLRDSHIPSARRLIISIQFQTKRSLPQLPYSPPLQAHLSIGKD